MVIWVNKVKVMDFVTRKNMANFLSQYGECDVTVDGMEAVDAFLLALEEEEPYDLICLDIMMPVMDGYKATMEIRELENKQLSRIPIIAMTANAFEEDRDKSYRSGMNEHIAKPVDIEKVLEIVKKVYSTL